jgi:ribonuclease E
VLEESIVLDADTSTPEEPTTETPAAPESPAAEAKPAKKAAKKTTKKATAKKAAKKTAAEPGDEAGESAPKKKAAKKTTKKAAAKAAAAPAAEAEAEQGGAAAPMVLFQAPVKTAAPARKRAAKTTEPAEPAEDAADAAAEPAQDAAPAKKATAKKTAKKTTAKKAAAKAAPADEPAEDADLEPGDADDETEGEGGPRRRRRRGGRRRRRGAGEGDAEAGEESDEPSEDGDEAEGEDGGPRRRTRTRVRKPRNLEDEITSIGGSTRLEAKKQRRREGREAGRRRAPIVSEAEFLARRESVDRVMVIRQRDDLTQIGVIEDKVLVEHYVARESQTSLIGNIYLGRVQNVLPSMEAAFIDIGKGRNAVLYAGEVNWSALGHKDGQPRKVESVLKSGQTILVQVTKDPVGHKGARLTGQISLPGRFLVYVPDGNTSGISRKLPDTERNRLKTLLKEIVPDTAGVIVRTAAEGASEEELTQDVERLTARWAEIEKKVAAGKSPDLLYGEPDLTLKVVRDLFTEDFAKLVVQGDDAWNLVEGYVRDVAPDLEQRLERYDAEGGKDIFAAYRVDEQIAKGLDRKVWLPSGGSLIIDRTEAMTVVDVNTGKFTGSGGNLEETVTKNNLEAAEEVVRQLRLRDIGGIIVVDFIDMVLESNRDLVLRRLVECLGRDRTRHQVAEVTSLGLVQMTRKRIGTGLLEAFGEECEHCKGRGVIVHDHPIDNQRGGSVTGGGAGGDEPRGRRGRGRGRGRGGENAPTVEPSRPSPIVLAGTKPHTPEELEAIEAEAAADLAEDLAAELAVITDAPVEENPVEEAASEEAAKAPEEAPEASAAPTAPVVVTTTRRRRAARPAGPAGATEPPAEQSVEQPAEQPVEESAEPDAGEPGESHVLHVPVKKRGSRKR